MLHPLVEIPSSFNWFIFLKSQYTLSVFHCTYLLWRGNHFNGISYCRYLLRWVQHL